MSQVMFLLDGSNFYSVIYPQLCRAAQEHNVQVSELESLYDWVIIEAIRRVVTVQVANHVRVDNHYRHDVYRCVYDSIGYTVEQFVVTFFGTNNIQFLKHANLKILVTYRDIVIVKKTN